jgi:hypothetical protein
MELERMVQYSPPSLHQSYRAGKRGREEEAEGPGPGPDQRVPQLEVREGEAPLRPDLPFSSMMRRMAARYSAPAPPAPHLHLALLSAPLHLAHPYSLLMAGLASAHSPPAAKRVRREEGPIDLSSTGEPEDDLDVVGVEEDDREEREREEGKRKLHQLLAAALLRRGGGQELKGMR